MMPNFKLMLLLLALPVAAQPPKKPPATKASSDREAILEAVSTPPNAVECHRSGLKSSVSSTWSFECKPVYRPKFDRVEWQERISIIGVNTGPCAESLNQCERTTMDHERAPGCGGVWPPPEECFLNQLRAEAPMLKSCLAAAECQAEAYVAMTALQADERKQKAAELLKTPKLPTCSYDGEPGEWTCKSKGCIDVQLAGVEVGSRDTDPCSWASSLGSELGQEIRHARCASNDKACDLRSKCIDTMRSALNEEAKDCRVLHRSPPGVQTATVCRSARWGRGQYDGMFGEANACRLLEPPVYAPDTAPDAGEPDVPPMVLDENRLDRANAQCVLAEGDADLVRHKYFNRCGQFCEGKSGVALCRAAGLSRDLEAACSSEWPKTEQSLAGACREWKEQRSDFESSIRDARRRATGRPVTFAIEGQRESYTTPAECEGARQLLAAKRREQAQADEARQCSILTSDVDNLKRQQADCRRRKASLFTDPCASWVEKLKEPEAALEKCKRHESIGEPVGACRRQ